MSNVIQSIHRKVNRKMEEKKKENRIMLEKERAGKTPTTPSFCSNETPNSDIDSSHLDKMKMTTKISPCIKSNRKSK